MSAHVVVIATDLRRTTVKVSPGTYLIDVLQEACKKLNLSSDKFLLKNKQKQVDLSVPYRNAGLTPGAKLELVQKANTPSAIQVALQLSPPDSQAVPGGRLIDKFPSDLPLWKVLRQFESRQADKGTNINITARGVAQTHTGQGGSGGGQLYYETPVLNIMGRELASFADFQKTLSQLGYNSGNVLVRLSYRRTDQTLFDAMSQIGQFFSEQDDEKKQPPVAADKSEPEITQEPVERSNIDDTVMADAHPTSQALVESSPQQPQDASTSPITGTNPGPTQTPDTLESKSKDIYEPVNVFLAPTSATPIAAQAAASETDFTPTVAHAQLHQARLQESSRNKRLLSDKELEERAAAEEAKIAAVKSVLIKVRFPDNTSSDWQAGPSETGAFLYEAVRHVMASAEHPFKLVLPGSSKTVIKDDAAPRYSLIKGYKLAGRVLVNLIWDDSVPAEVRKRSFLKSEVARQGQKLIVPEVPQEVEDKKDIPQPGYKPEEQQKPRTGGDGSGKKIPKWLKLGKK